jgi:hypothetical protein
MSYEFSDEDISMLAEVERRMDAGDTPYVILNGERVAMFQDVMDDLGLKKGQTITRVIFHHILLKNLAKCEAQLVILNASKNSPGNP